MQANSTERKRTLYQGTAYSLAVRWCPPLSHLPLFQGGNTGSNPVGDTSNSSIAFTILRSMTRPRFRGSERGAALTRVEVPVPSQTGRSLNHHNGLVCKGAGTHHRGVVSAGNVAQGLGSKRVNLWKPLPAVCAVRKITGSSTGRPTDCTSRTAGSTWSSAGTAVLVSSPCQTGLNRRGRCFELFLLYIINM